MNAPTSTSLSTTTHPSPVGMLTLVASDAGLRAILWPDDTPGRVRFSEALLENPDHPILRQAMAQLDAYFAGERSRFDIPLDVAGTDFQLEVWTALGRIPFGVKTSYGELAAEIGKPGSARAVGAAVGRNPISIVVPCHRVLGKDGRLTGFAGGLEAKTRLLALEA